jgi:CubicO group peptidase (beta-lactamase class C family)
VHVVTAGAMAVGGPPMRRDTLFRISSRTKPMTAAAVLSLVDDGLLELNAAVDDLLPELSDRRVLSRPDGPPTDTVPARRPITVRGQEGEPGGVLMAQPAHEPSHHGHAWTG